MQELWVDKYRPKTMQDYVYCNDIQKNQIETWVKQKALPHLLFHGPAGSGKTSLAIMLLKELNVEDFDILMINGSAQNGVDTIRDSITNFVTTMPWGEFRYVLIDESDFVTANGQAALRNLMETYSNTARFILTCNYPTKIIPALHSRCQSLQIEKLNKDDFTIHIAQILCDENITFNIEVLDLIVASAYPDMRKTINLAQQYSTSGTLVLPDTKSSSTADYKIAAITLFKDGKYKEARQLICKEARPEEYEEWFTFMYQNVEIWAKSEQQENEAIVIIRNGLAKAPLCADQELNLSATLCELSLLGK